MFYLFNNSPNQSVSIKLALTKPNNFRRKKQDKPGK